MSQASDLLATLEENYPVHDHNVTDPDNYFVIDPDTRQISNLSQSANVLMQNDHNSEVYTFEIPRFVEGHDMLTCDRVRVHYINAAKGTSTKHSDVYEMTDLKVNPENADTLISTWTIKRQATQHAGTLSFVVQYTCVDESITDEQTSNISYEWHTDIYKDVEVRKTINNSEEAVADYSDILENWYQQLFGMEDTLVTAVVDATNAQKTAIQLKGEETLATIPEDYTATYNMADEALRKKANAIEETVEGEAIVIDDSADAYLLGLNLYGKTTQVTTTGAQLLNITDAAAKTDRGLTQIITNGACVVKGTANSTAAFNLTLAGTYGGTTVLFTLEPGTYTATDCIISSYDGTTRTNHTGTFTLTKPLGVTWVSTRSYGTTEVVNETTYPMLNVGNAALEWERYSGGAASPRPDFHCPLVSIDGAGVEMYGKNLLKPKGMNGSGYTATVNPDGSVTVTGAATTTNAIYLTIATASTMEPLYLRKGVPYFMWGKSSNGKDIGTKTVDCYGNSVWGSTTAWNKNFNSDFDRVVQIYVESVRHEIGDTSLCGTYWFQLEVGTEFTGFEAHKDVQKLSVSNTLHGIPVSQNGNYTDGTGRQWICDEIDFERGVYIQRIGATDLTNAEWTTNTNGQFFTTLDSGKYATGTDVLSNKLIGGTDIYINAVNTIRLNRVIGDGTITSITAALADCTLIAPLLNPIETPLTDEEIALYKRLKSNYHNTTVLNDAGAHMLVKYNADTKMFFENHSIATDEQVRAAANAWLNEHFSSGGSYARIGEVTLLASKWTGSGNLYSQVVSVAGITENSQVDLTPSVEQLVTFYEKDLTFVTENDGGVLTVYAIGQKPANDYTVQVTITEVNL